MIIHCCPLLLLFVSVSSQVYNYYYPDSRTHHYGGYSQLSSPRGKLSFDNPKPTTTSFILSSTASQPFRENKRTSKCECGRTDETSSRIINGDMVYPQNKYPWMALITTDSNQLCGGALINNRFILTAAHCIESCEDNLRKCKVVLGTNNSSQSQFVYDIEKTIKHNDYSLFLNDVGLIQLRKKVSFTDAIQSICLPNKMSEKQIRAYEDPIVVAGWGLTNTGKESDVLMEFTAEDWLTKDENEKFCKELLCLRRGRGRFESGDSGGPAWIYKNGKAEVIGVVSHYRLHRMRLTRVPLVVDWIKANTRFAQYCH